MITLRTIMAGLLAGLMLTGCTTESVEEAAIDLRACKMVRLADATDGTLITGAEDIAVDPVSDLVFISAYDRFALEDALEDDARFLPRGGLYVVPFDDLLAANDLETPVTIRDILTPLLGEREIRPHGIDLYTGPLGNRVLAAIVHRYSRDGMGEDSTWARQSGLEIFEITDDGLEHRAGVQHSGLCQANDVAVVGPRRFLVTRDHGTCGDWMWAEDVLGLKRAGVVHVELTDQDGLDRAPVPVAGRIGFANGITIDRERRRLVVAATREKALLVYDLDTLLAGAGGKPVGRVALPGGPDNLTMAGSNTVLAAVHPSLLEMGFYRRRWFDATHAPGRVVQVDLRNAEQSVVYDDPDGSLFPAVTTGLQHRDHLILGSVGAKGLMLCGMPTARETP